jgi:hypothetical protein
MNRKQVYELIDGEREYQNSRWNDKTSSSGGWHLYPEQWIIYMEDYLQEAKHLISRESGDTAYPKAMEIIRKVTAMGVAAMEQIETKPRITQ